MDIKLFKKAIEIATDKGKCNKGYIGGIIRQWLNNNIKTYDDLMRFLAGILKNTAARNQELIIRK